MATELAMSRHFRSHHRLHRLASVVAMAAFFSISTQQASAATTLLDLLGVGKSISDFSRALDRVIEKGLQRMNNILDSQTRLALDRLLVAAQTFRIEAERLESRTFDDLDMQRQKLARDIAILGDNLDRKLGGDVVQLTGSVDELAATVRQAIPTADDVPVLLDYTPTEFLPGGNGPLTITLDGINFRAQTHRLIVGGKEATLAGITDTKISFLVAKNQLTVGNFGLIYAKAILVSPTKPWFGDTPTYTYNLPFRPLSGAIGSFMIKVDREIGKIGEPDSITFPLNWTTSEDPSNDRPVNELSHLDCTTIKKPDNWEFTLNKAPYRHNVSMKERGLISHLYEDGKPVDPRKARNGLVILSSVQESGVDGFVLAAFDRLPKIHLPHLPPIKPLHVIDRKWKGRSGKAVGSIEVDLDASNLTRICIRFTANAINTIGEGRGYETRRWAISRDMSAQYDVSINRIEAEMVSDEEVKLPKLDNQLYWNSDKDIPVPEHITDMRAVITFDDTGETRTIRPNETVRGVRLDWVGPSRVAVLRTAAQ